MLEKILIAITIAAGICFSKSYAATPFETTQYSDSVVSVCYRAVCSYDISYPTELATPSDRAIARWTAEFIGAGRDADVSSFPKLVRAVAHNEIRNDVAELRDFTDESNCEWQTSYETDIRLNVAYSTPKFITLIGDTYIYRGGNHGMSGHIGLTFLTSNGKTLGYDIFTRSSLRMVTALVRDAIRKQYFDCSLAEFRNSLQVEYSQFKLPEAVPFLSAKGVTFVYNAYEIAPYSAGLPECTIPYSDLMPYLTPAVKSLLK